MQPSSMGVTQWLQKGRTINNFPWRDSSSRRRLVVLLDKVLFKLKVKAKESV